MQQICHFFSYFFFFYYYYYLLLSRNMGKQQDSEACSHPLTFFTRLLGRQR